MAQSKFAVPVEIYVMADRKQALKHMEGKIEVIEEHLAKLASNPNSRDVPHWIVEINTWLREINS